MIKEARIITTILTSGRLIRELIKTEDEFITVILDGKEYVIDGINRIYEHVDNPSSHLCLNIRDGGSGYIKR